EGESVRGDPARDVHADGAQLARVRPDAGAARDAARLDAVIARDADHQLLDGSDVLAHVLAIGLQIEDRITDDLPRPVIRHAAAGDASSSSRCSSNDQGSAE